MSMLGQAVNSSNLCFVAYNPWSATLTIEFHGGRVYQYYRVPHSEYSGLLNARSHGQYFHERIKGCYTYKRVA